MLQGANWKCVGSTLGRGRQDREHRLEVPVKDLYLYRLTQQGRPA
ncbi:MAG: hypothetical protein KF791_03400 [Verrucomicrobiae bacterium]|nr:hypothetical protein [Verrucomicrobiae bacterium]